MFVPPRADTKYFDDPGEFPGLVRKHLVMRRLQLWMRPSFDPSQSWSLYRDKGRCLVRRVTIEPVDTPGIPDQIVTCGEAFLPLAQLESLCRGLEGLRLTVPAVNEELAGLDGTTYGVELKSFPFQFAASWWEEVPAEWKGLDAWWIDAKAQIEKAFELPG